MKGHLVKICEVLSTGHDILSDRALTRYTQSLIWAIWLNDFAKASNITASVVQLKICTCRANQFS